jgi:branched-chain amino acid transport system permease protein
MVALTMQSLIGGLLMGSIYALLAVGLNMVFGGMRVVNNAHANFVVLGSYLAYALFRRFNLDPLISIFPLMIPFFLLGVLIQRFLIEPLKQRKAALLTTMLVMAGVWIIIETLSLVIWTADYRFVKAPYTGTSFEVLGMMISKTKLIFSMVAAVLLLLIYLFLTRTDRGRAIRAITEDREASQLMGVKITEVTTLTFGLAIALAGAGGGLMSTMYAFYPAMADVWRGRLFCIVILGGLGSIPGSIVAAFIFGVVEALVTLYASAIWTDVVTYSLVIIVLLIKPSGLMGRFTE